MSSMVRSPMQRADSAHSADPTPGTAAVDFDSASMATPSTTGTPMSVIGQEQLHEAHKAESSTVESTCTPSYQNSNAYVLPPHGEMLPATEVMLSGAVSGGLPTAAPVNDDDATSEQAARVVEPSITTGASRTSTAVSSECSYPASLAGATDAGISCTTSPHHCSGRSGTPDMETSQAEAGTVPAGRSRQDHPASGAGNDDPSSGGDIHASEAAYQARTPYGGDSDYLSGAATVGLESVESGGRQPAFEAAKRIVALYPYYVAERTSLLRGIGSRFSNDVHIALDPKRLPPLQMKWSNENSSLGPVGFTDLDRKRIQEALGIIFVNAGGSAGGIKAVHERLGLFLKFAFDQESIYGSSRMAAKAAKREASASRWVHAMDSVHVSTPLLECVDIRVALKSGGYCTIRVQAFARIDVRGCKKYDEAEQKGGFTEEFKASVNSTTMRVGSADSMKSIHWDDEQLEDVVKPLAKHFYLSPGLLMCKALVCHSYPPATDAHDEGCHDGSGTFGEDPQASVLDFPGGSMEVSVLEAVKAACNPSVEYFENYATSKLTGNQYELARQAFYVVYNGKVDLRTYPSSRGIRHNAYPTKMDGLYAGSGSLIQPHLMPKPTEFHLPFDVEIHQLPSGERMVLDTHRLLIPDVPWIQWMKSSVEAKPRVWVVRSSGAAASPPQVVQLSGISTDRNAALNTWAEQNGIPSHFEPAVDYPELGCAIAVTKSSSGSPGMLAIMSCPSWYYRGNVSLTCLLPPEAAKVLQSSRAGDGMVGLCPDAIMKQIRIYTRFPLHEKHPELDHAEAVISELYSRARQSGPEQIIRELEKSKADPIHDRTILKRAMHSIGLGLRHARIVLQGFGSGHKVFHDRIIRALAHGSDVVHDLLYILYELLPVDQRGRAYQLAAMSGLFASKGLLFQPIEFCLDTQEARSEIYLPQDAGSAVIGAELAITGGIHAKSALDGLQSLLDELGHLQRVGGTGYGDLLNALCTLAYYSAGLRWIRPVVRARQAQEAFTGLIDDISSRAAARAAASGSYPRRPQYNTTVLCRLADIGETLVRQGKYMEAMKIYEFCCDRMDRKHADYSTLVLLIAKCFMKQRKLGAALDKFKECIALMAKDRHGYCELLYDASECYMRRGDSGDYAAARELCSQSVSKQLHDFNYEHPRYAIALSYQADVFSRLREFAKAEEMYQKASTILLSTLGSDHPDYAKVIHRWGNCLAAYKKHRPAEEKFRVCLSIRSKVLDYLHPDYITTLSHIATQVSWQAQGAMWDALELEDKCRELRAAVLGKSHPEYGQSLLNLLIYIDSCLLSRYQLRAGRARLSDESLNTMRDEVYAYFQEFEALKRLRTFIPILLSELPCRVSTIRLAFLKHSHRLRHKVGSAASYGSILDTLEELRQDGIVQTDLSYAALQRDYFMCSTAPPVPASSAKTAAAADGSAPPASAPCIKTVTGTDRPKTESVSVVGAAYQAQRRMLFRYIYASLKSPSTSEKSWALRVIALVLVDSNARDLGTCVQEDALIQAIDAVSAQDPEQSHIGDVSLAMYRQAAGCAFDIGTTDDAVAPSEYTLRVYALLCQDIDWTFLSLDRELSIVSCGSAIHDSELLEQTLESLKRHEWTKKGEFANAGTFVPTNYPVRLGVSMPSQSDGVAEVKIPCRNQSADVAKEALGLADPGTLLTWDTRPWENFASVSAITEGLSSRDSERIATALEHIDTRCRMPRETRWSSSERDDEGLSVLVGALIHTATRDGIPLGQKLHALASLGSIASHNDVVRSIAREQGAIELAIYLINSSNPDAVHVAVRACKSIMFATQPQVYSLVRPLVRLCYQKQNSQVLYFASDVLSRMANYYLDTVKDCVDAESALPGLVSLLLRVPYPGRVAILLSRIIADSEADATSFIQAGGLGGLAHVLFSRHGDSIVKVGWLVKKLAYHSLKIKKAIASSGVLHGLANAMGRLGREAYIALNAYRVLLSDCTVAHRPAVQSGLLAPLVWIIRSVGHSGGCNDQMVEVALDIVVRLASNNDPVIVQALAGSGVLRVVSRCRKCSSFGIAVQANNIHALLYSQLVEYDFKPLSISVPEKLLRMPIRDEHAVVRMLQELVISQKHVDSGIYILAGAGIMGVLEGLCKSSDEDVASTAAGLLELAYADLETYHVPIPDQSELSEFVQSPSRGSERRMILAGLATFASIIASYGMVGFLY